MKPEVWKPVQRSEEQYARDVFEILKRAFAEGTERVRQAGIPEWLDLYSQQAARRMITSQFVDNERTWRAAARASMRGRELYGYLDAELHGPIGRRVQQLINSNAQLIRSLPERIAEKVSAHVAEKALGGERSTETAEEIRQYTRRLAGWHVRMIARTETGKASTALTRARAESLSLDWYVWETDQDKRVRQSHRRMQGVICNWNDPPSPETLIGMKSEGHYAPGDIYNCRCYPAPLLRLDQVRWPHKLYYGGRIVYATLSEFRRISNFQQSAAAA